MKTIVLSGPNGPFIKHNVPDGEVESVTERLESQGYQVVEVREENE